MSMSLEMQIDKELQNGESIYNLSTIVKGWNLSQNDSNAANTHIEKLLLNYHNQKNKALALSEGMTSRQYNKKNKPKSEKFSKNIFQRLNKK